MKHFFCLAVNPGRALLESGQILATERPGPFLKAGAPLCCARLGNFQGLWPQAPSAKSAKALGSSRVQHERMDGLLPRGSNSSMGPLVGACNKQGFLLLPDLPS